jgi:prevent-host-death family protein
MKAQKSLSSIIKDIEKKYDRFTITQNGISKAVILSSEEFESLMETLDILSHKEEREAIARAKKQIKRHQTTSLVAVKKKYGLK